MARVTKRKKEFTKLVEKTKIYSLDEAIAILKKAPKTKFDQTVELAVKLDVNPQESASMVRGTVALPHGTGRNIRVAVFTRGEERNKALEAGADFVGADDLINKVSQGWCDFDAAVATPDMMKDMAKLGKVLGPRGLMPNPKAGTVTQDVTRAVKEVKAGKIEFKMDKQSNINIGIGKISFPEAAILENASTALGAINQVRPASVKASFIKSVAISSTMGPGLKIKL